VAKTREIPKLNIEIRPSIGLYLITEEPGTGGEIVVILRRRGETKFDCDTWKGEPWAGAHVAPAHGKSRWKETPEQTLWRKAEDQMGQAFCRAARLRERSLFLLSENKEKKGRTYGVCVNYKCIRCLRSDSASAGFVAFPISEIHKIRELTLMDRETPITDIKDIAMFPDEIQALRAIEGNRQLLSFLHSHNR
jgi:hypothetical protein